MVGLPSPVGTVLRETEEGRGPRGKLDLEIGKGLPYAILFGEDSYGGEDGHGVFTCTRN